ncbi:MAG: hypothetical protein ABSF28_26685 [Terracidiphilus sp.]
MLLGLILLLPELSDIALAQQPNPQRKTFIGPYDSEFPYPVAEGRIGEKDAAALAEIKQSVGATGFPERAGIEAQGLYTNGSAKTEQQFPASVAIEKDGRFRLDVQKRNGIFSIRLALRSGQAMRESGLTYTVHDIDFGEPIAMPSQLLEVADREDAAVVDDGDVVIGDYRMRRVTITLFHSQMGDPAAAAFYFDPLSHLLEKSVLVSHSGTNRSLEYLKVITYGSYRAEQGVTLPHEYSETVNGQLIMTLKITSANVTSRHDDTYFKF